MINRVNIYIDPADWLKLRHLCLEKGTNPSRIVRQLIASYLSEETVQGNTATVPAKKPAVVKKATARKQAA